MNPEITMIFVTAVFLLVPLIFICVLFTRYVKVGPNQVLIVSGRKVQLPDGRTVGFRMVKGGGTFVLPVLERADALSLEVMTLEMPRSKAQTAGGRTVEADCFAQVKINSDDASVVAAAEHFLTKNQTEIKNCVRPVLEKHLASVMGGLPLEDATQNPAACADQVQAAAAEDLSKMGLSLVSFTIRSARTA